METEFVAYYRVSTQQQGVSGLGLEAQQEAVSRYLATQSGTVIASFVETESGRKANRPKLQEALSLCRKTRSILVIAKLDRLARNVHFISGLLESNVSFIAVDQPTKNRFMMHLQAAFAEEEARRISERTREALAAAKRRGVRIGETGRQRALVYQQQATFRAQSYRSVVEKLIWEGVRTVREIRDRLNEASVPSPGGGKWHIPNTHRLLNRLGIRLNRFPRAALKA